MDASEFNFKPMLAETATEPFDDPNFIYEWKWNGVRVLAHKDGGEIRLQGRNGLDMTDAFPEMAGIGKFIKTDRALIDGEFVVLNEKGLPEFNRIQNRFNQSDPAIIQRNMAVFGKATYMVFDVPRVDDYDLTNQSSQPLTLMQRKEVLSKLVIPDSVIKLSDFIDGKGKEMHALAVKLHQEGVMAKTKTGLYVPGGRNKDWQKIKVPKFRNFVVCGYTQGTGWHEDTFGSLVLGVPDKGGYRYVGSAGSGFKAQGVKDMYVELLANASDDSPMMPGTKVPQLLSWCHPTMVVRVKYYDITKEGMLIWPIYQKVVSRNHTPEMGQVGFDYVPEEGE